MFIILINIIQPEKWFRGFRMAASPLPKLIVFCVLVFVFSWVIFPNAAARQCTCEQEVQELKQHIAMNQQLLAAFQVQSGNYKFPNIYDTAPASNPDELGSRVKCSVFGQCGSGGQPGGQAGASGPDPLVMGNRVTFRATGGINPACWNAYCDITCTLIGRHEEFHDTYDTIHGSLPRMLWMTFVARQSHAEYTAESEVDAYRNQISLEQEKLKIWLKKCGFEYKCSYTGEKFNDAVTCVINCPQSLKHFGRLCLEVDKETGIYTGNAY